MIPSLAEILKAASNIDSREERVALLRRFDSWALRRVVFLAYSPMVEWDLPKGWKPDFTPNKYIDQYGALLQQVRKLDKFLVDGYPGLSLDKKQLLFIQLLEQVHPDDAELLNAMKNKKLPWKGLGFSVMSEAFPDLFPTEDKVEDESVKDEPTD